MLDRFLKSRRCSGCGSALKRVHSMQDLINDTIGKVMFWGGLALAAFGHGSTETFGMYLLAGSLVFIIRTVMPAHERYQCRRCAMPDNS